MKKMNEFFLFIFPYGMLTFQYFINLLEESINDNSLLIKLFLYAFAGSFFGLVTKISMKINDKSRLIINSINLIILFIFLSSSIYSIESLLSIRVNPFTSFWAYKYASVVGMICIGYIIVDIISILKYYYIRKEKI